MLLSCSRLTRLSANNFTLEQYTLALVRLRLAERTNLGTDETEQLLVASLESDDRILVSLTLSLHLNLRRKLDEDGVSVTESELDDVALVRNTIPDSDKLKYLLVALANAYNHVVDE